MLSEARSTLDVGGESYEIFRLAPLQDRFDVERLPYTLKILLENVLRTSTEAHVQAVAEWVAKDDPSREISFTPARVIHQDFTGVPAIVDLAAMRHAMHDLGGIAANESGCPPSRVIDHSVQVDAFANRMAMRVNTDREYERNRERYAFLRWGQQAFDDLKVVRRQGSSTRSTSSTSAASSRRATVRPIRTRCSAPTPTTMINGLGVLGWGVGGIEAEAAMLGESVSMLVPQVVGFRLSGALREGATATDLVLTVTQILRQTGVVGKFVEYFGAGVSNTLAARATIGNMSPEYGRRCGFFPVDEVTPIPPAHGTRRAADRARRGVLQGEPALARPRARPTYTQVVELDLGDVEPSLAGPRRPQDRVPLTEAKRSFLGALETFGVDYGTSLDEQLAETFPASRPSAASCTTALEPDPLPVAAC